MRYLILVLLTFGISAVHADGFFRPAVSYTIDNSESGGTTTKKSRRMIDLGGGYIADKGFTVIGQYSMESKVTQTTASTGPGTSTTSTVDTNRNSMGAGIGWTSRKEIGPYVDAIYYLQSEEDESGITYKGTGYQADLGLKISLQKFAVGFQLSYRSFKYTKMSNGTALTQTRSRTNLDPTIAAIIEF